MQLFVYIELSQLNLILYGFHTEFCQRDLTIVYIAEEKLIYTVTASSVRYIKFLLILAKVCGQFRPKTLRSQDILG